MPDNTNPNQNSSSDNGQDPVKFFISAKDSIATHGNRRAKTGGELHMMARIPDDEGNPPSQAVGRTAFIDAVRIGGGPWAKDEPKWEFATGQDEPIASTHNGETFFKWTSPGGGGQYDYGPYIIKATAGGVTQQVTIVTHKDKVLLTKEKVGLDLIATGFKEVGDLYANHYKLVANTGFGFTSDVSEYSELQDEWNSTEVAEGFFYHGTAEGELRADANLDLMFGSFYVDKFKGGLSVKPGMYLGLSWNFYALRYCVSKDPEAPLPGRWSGTISATAKASGHIGTTGSVSMTDFGTNCFKSASAVVDAEVSASASVSYNVSTQECTPEIKPPSLKGNAKLIFGKYDIFGHPEDTKGPKTITSPDLGLDKLLDPEGPKKKIVLPKHGHGK